jgi:hypothetical protein
LNLQKQKRDQLDQLIDSQLDRGKAHLNSRLVKLQSIIDSVSSDSSEKSRLIDELNRIRRDIKKAKERHLKKIISQIEDLEQKSSQLDICQPAISEQKPKITRTEVTEKLESLKEKIDTFDEEHIKLVQKKFEKIKGTVDQIEDKLTGNFDFYYSMLKNLEAELFELKKVAEQKFQEYQLQKTQLQEQLSLLLARLDVIAEKSQFEPQRQQAIALRNALSDILQQNDVSVLISGYSQFQSQVRELEVEFESLAAKESDRQFILQQTEEVLKEMGYEVIHMPYRPVNDPYGALAMNFKAPAGQGVRISVNLSHTVHKQFCQLVPQENLQDSRVDEQQLLSQCKSWCTDYEKLIEKLKTRGIDLTKNWHFPADLAQIDKIEVPAEILKELEQEQYDEQRYYQTGDEPQRRTMQ